MNDSSSSSDDWEDALILEDCISRFREASSLQSFFTDSFSENSIQSHLDDLEETNTSSPTSIELPRSTVHFSSQDLIVSIKRDWNISNKMINTIPFHILAGEAITLEHEEYIAKKKADSAHTDGRFVFSHQPLIPGDTWYLKILGSNSSTSSKQHLGIGITSYDVMTLEGFDIPENERDINNMPGYWVMSKDFTSPGANEFFSIALSDEGCLCYRHGRGSEEKLFFCDVSQPIWIFIDCGPFDKIVSIGLSSGAGGNPSSKINSSSVPSTSGDAKTSQPAPVVVENSSNCVICRSAKAEMIIYNCGHLCMCPDCSKVFMRNRKSMRICPICRKEVKDVIKIYSA